MKLKLRLRLKLHLMLKLTLKLKLELKLKLKLRLKLTAKAKVNTAAKAEVEPIAKAKASKAKFESQARHNGGTPDQHDGGMIPKWPESNFKANSKASRHDGYVCITGEWGEAADSTLLLLANTIRTLIS